MWCTRRWRLPMRTSSSLPPRTCPTGSSAPPSTRRSPRRCTHPGSSRRSRPRSVHGEARDRENEVQVAAELVDPPHVSRQERRAFGLRQVSIGQDGARIRAEARAKLAVFLQPIEKAVDGVAAHSTLHSTAARLIRPSSPKYRTSARAGVMAPMSTIQLRNSCSPLLCSSSALRRQSGSCSPCSSQWRILRSKTVSDSPTRATRSSGKCERPPVAMIPTFHGLPATTRAMCRPKSKHRDRKSTRLNSSHSQISYAVFCLKKKKKERQLLSAALKHTRYT